MNNRDIVAKADIAVSNLIADGGYLNADQSAKFIQMLIDEPTIINQARVVQMNSPRKRIEKIGFGSRILNVAPSSGTSLAAGRRSRPDLDLLTMTTTELLAEVWIPYDVLEDNIEKGGLEDTIMSMIVTRTSLDLEELLILGNTSSSDTYLATMDGILELTPTRNIYEAGGVTNITRTLFKTAMQMMPTRYLRNRALMRFFTSHNVEMEYRDSLAGRATGLGDNLHQTFNPVFAYGTQLVPCALMPDDRFWFSYPNNIVFGVQREITIEADRDIRRRVLIIVLTLRIAIALEEPTAAVIIQNFADTGMLTSTTTSSSTTTTA